MTKKQKMTKENLEKCLNNIQTDSKRITAINLIDEIVFLVNVLEKLKKEIAKTGVIDDFKQGVQQFKRESPALKSYNTTLQRYTALYKQFTNLIENEESEEETNPVIAFLGE